jgi:RNA polymerase sigma factor (TIGR02999 family)
MAKETSNSTVATPTDPLFADIYERLKSLASRQRSRGGASGTLCTTELVHEVYLKVGEANDRFQHEGQFFAYAARAMRHILTDAARRRLQPRQGGGLVRVALDNPIAHSVNVDPQLALQLDAALTALEREDPRAAQVVELHFFSGLEMQHVADILGVTRRTIDRDWRYARVFLATHAKD